MQRTSITTYSRRLLLALGLTLSGCGGGDSETPATPVTQYSVQLSVSNLQGSLAMQLNGQSNITVSKDGTYTFDKQLTSGTAYAVTVTTQPGYQQCTVTAGTGTIVNNNITNIAVACTDQVQMTSLSEYYPASLVHFSLPASTTENLTVTSSGTPLTVQKGSDGSQFVMLPNNAAGAVDLKYSIGSFSRTKAITVQPLTVPSDPKTYVATQYQTLLTNAQRLQNASGNPSLYEGLISELEKSKSQLASLTEEQQAALALYLMQLTQPAAGASNFKDTSQLAMGGTSCNVFVDNFNAKWVKHGLALYISIGAFSIGDPWIKAFSTAGMLVSFYNLTELVDKLFNDGRSCIQLIRVVMAEELSGVAIVPPKLAQNYTQSTSVALLKTGSTYRYTLKPTIGFDALIASALSSVSADLRRILRPLPNAITQPVLSLLDRIDSPVLNDLSYQVTADPITGVNMDINVDGNKLTVSPRISDLSKLTQSNYPTKLHIKTSLGEKVEDVDATVVVDFKPVVQNTQLQAIINKKTEGKLIAENVTSFAVVTQPTLGVLNLDTKTGAFDYTPNADTVGKKDSFTVRGTYLLGGDPSKSYVSELATINVDIISAEICFEDSMKDQAETSARVTINCYYDTSRKNLKSTDSYEVSKSKDGVSRGSSNYFVIRNLSGQILELEYLGDFEAGNGYGSRLITLSRQTNTFDDKNNSENTYRSHRYVTDQDGKILGNEEDRWNKSRSNSENIPLSGDSVLCVDLRWFNPNKNPYFVRTIFDAGVSTTTNLDSCPNQVVPTDKIQVLTKDSKAKKRFFEIFPNF